MREVTPETPKRPHRVAVIPGDGIGPEVTAQAIKVLQAVSSAHGIEMSFDYFPLGASFYLEHGEAIPDSMEKQLREFDAIFFGAIGDPAVPPGVLEQGLVLRLRRSFDQYVNVRPAKLYPGVPSAVVAATPTSCDMVVLRENTEGLYVGSGAHVHAKSDRAVATQNSISTRRGTERLLRYGFEVAQQRRGHLTLVHKTNILTHAGELWLDALEDVQRDYPAVEVDYAHIDAMCAYLVTAPERFDVIATDNLFGDILSDLAAAVQGGLGLAASANLNPERTAPSMFEPVHGSAPDIAGRGWANPAAAMLSGMMMLRHLGEETAASDVERAVSSVLADLGAMAGPKMGHTTDEIGDLVATEVVAGSVLLADPLVHRIT